MEFNYLTEQPDQLIETKAKKRNNCLGLDGLHFDVDIDDENGDTPPDHKWVDEPAPELQIDDQVMTEEKAEKVEPDLGF